MQEDEDGDRAHEFWYQSTHICTRSGTDLPIYAGVLVQIYPRVHITSETSRQIPVGAVQTGGEIAQICDARY